MKSGPPSDSKMDLVRLDLDRKETYSLNNILVHHKNAGHTWLRRPFSLSSLHVLRISDMMNGAVDLI